MSSGRPLPSEAGAPLVIGHRGAKAYLPENTLPAYALALAQGADMLEIDLHRSRDGAIPIVHDAALDELGREGEVADVSLEELRALHDRSVEGFAPASPSRSHVVSEIGAIAAGESFAGVPDLDQVLDRFASETPFNLEIKTDVKGRPYPGLQQDAVEAVVSRGVLFETLFSSFWDPVLHELRDLSPDARLALLIDPRFPKGMFERAAAAGVEAVNPYVSLVSADLVQEAHARGLAVFVYTVDDEQKMHDLLDLGVDGIFSNCPDILRSVVDSRS